MGVIKQITGGGSWNHIRITGTNRNEDIGLSVDVPEGEILVLSSVYISNVFIPLIKTGKGILMWESLYVENFGGDATNIRGSNIDSNKLVVRNNTPTRPYKTCVRQSNESVEACLSRNGEVVYDPDLLKFQLDTRYYAEGREILGGYHCDGVSQLYAVKPDGYTTDPDGVIENIRIRNIDARLSGRNTQGVMGSGMNRYSNIRLGEDRYQILTDGYPYHTVFNQLDNSTIGGKLNCVILGTQVKVLAAKPTKFHTYNNTYPSFSRKEVVGDRDVNLLRL